MKEKSFFSSPAPTNIIDESMKENSYLPAALFPSCLGSTVQLVHLVQHQHQLNSLIRVWKRISFCTFFSSFNKYHWWKYEREFLPSFLSITSRLNGPACPTPAKYHWSEYETLKLSQMQTKENVPDWGIPAHLRPCTPASRLEQKASRRRIFIFVPNGFSTENQHKCWLRSCLEATGACPLSSVHYKGTCKKNSLT